MKVFTNKDLLRKIVMILIIILLFEYAVPTNVSNAVDWGGVLFTPIQQLTLAIGDVGVTGLNLFIYGQSRAILTLYKDDSFLRKALDFGITVGSFVTLGWVGIAAKTAGEKVVSSFSGDKDFVDKIELPTMLVTPDQIFSNKVGLLDVNIINPNKYINEDTKEEIKTPVTILKSTIASWYIILRDICIVAFLSILVYIGIRILISSASDNKAKYKQMLFDWIVGLCLLFVMHYIMSFSITMVEKLTELVDIENKAIAITSDDVNLKDYNADNDKVKGIVQKYNEKGVGTLSWKTDMMGYIRFYAQTNINSHAVATQFAYTLMYIVLVIYTYMFVFQYLKRLLSIIFLTLIAPVVALTYPIEKVKGNAQAFNTWLKEYIFNLLLQPMHLILYTVFVGSALQLVTQYPIYAIVVLGFLLEAEKIVRKMFGFDKETLTGAAAGGLLTGAMVMKGMDSILNKGKRAASGAKGNDKKVGEGSKDRVRMADRRKADNPSGEDDFMRSVLGAGGTDNNSDNDNDNGTDNDNSNEDALSNYDTPIMPPNDEPLLDDNNDNLDNIDSIVPDKNYLHMMHPDQYDEYGNYIQRDGTQYDSKDNIGNKLNNNDNLDNIDSIVPDKNYLHMMHPDQYDEYGNAIERNGKQLKKEKTKRRKVKSRPARVNRIKPKVKSGAKTVARYAGAGVRFYAPKVAKTAVKAAAMGVVGGTAGMIGLAAGLATDKPSNAITYTMGAVAGGATVGKAFANRTIQGPSNIKTKVQETRDNMAREAYRNDPTAYKQYLNKQADKDFMKNKEIKLQYQEAFGKSRVKEMMENAKKYREHGITDNELIIKTMKESSGEIGKTDVTDNRRIAAAKLASGVSNAKDIESMTKRLKKQGYKDEVINQNEEFVRSIRNLKYN